MQGCFSNVRLEGLCIYISLEKCILAFVSCHGHVIRPIDTKVATLPYDCIGRAWTEDEVMLDGSKVWKVATDRQVHGGRHHHLTCSR